MCSERKKQIHYLIYEGRLQSSWIRLTTLNWNFIEVQWLSLFRSISLGKRCTSYNAPPTSRKRAAGRWSLRNFLHQSSLFMIGKAQKLHEARSALYGGWSNGVPPIHFFQAEHRIQFTSRPMLFLGFSNHEKGALKQEISKRSTVCSMFSRSGWSVVRSALLAKGGTSKKRPSPHLHKVPTQSNKVSLWTLQTALIVFIQRSHSTSCGIICPSSYSFFCIKIFCKFSIGKQKQWLIFLFSICIFNFYSVLKTLYLMLISWQTLKLQTKI
jgi:hypothetical protein